MVHHVSLRLQSQRFRRELHQLCLVKVLRRKKRVRLPSSRRRDLHIGLRGRCGNGRFRHHFLLIYQDMLGTGIKGNAEETVDFSAGSTAPSCRDNKTIEHASSTLLPTFMSWCGKHLWLRHFMLKNDRFPKTGSKQNTGKVKGKGASCRATHPLGVWSKPVMVYDGVAQVFQCDNGLFRHFCIKTIILPRQARDKHRGNLKKSTVFGDERPAAFLWRHKLCGDHQRGRYEKRSVCPHVFLEHRKDRFIKTGSGQTQGEIMEPMPFEQAVLSECGGAVARARYATRQL